VAGIQGFPSMSLRRVRWHWNLLRHSGEGRNPVLLAISGPRLSPGWRYVRYKFLNGIGFPLVFKWTARRDL